jgi:hypothetical protein
VTDRDKFGRRTFDVGDLRIFEQRSVKDNATPVDHPDQEASGISGKAIEPGDESVVFCGKDRPVRRLHEAEHLREMIEIVIGRQDRQFHRAHFPSSEIRVTFLFCSGGHFKSQ